MAAEAELTGIAALGINGKALVFQIVNFLILLVILKVIAYKPIIAMLERRRKTIEESLQKAKEIEDTHLMLQEKTQAILQKAKTQADKVVNQAKEVGESVKKELIEQSKRQQEQIMEQAKGQIALEKEAMIHEAKKELGYVVMAAASRVIEANIDTKRNEKLVSKVMRGME